MTWTEAERFHLNLSLSVLNGQFHCSLQTFLITCCPGNVTNIFGDRPRGDDLGGQGRCGTYFFTCALMYKILISLGYNLGSTVEVAGIK